jgi:small nuclear ribonucleoprotein (snRNP)-like protein
VPDEPAFARYVNEVVVVDTRSRYVYVGRLREVSGAEVVLVDADVHDLDDAASSRDSYILRARTDGVNENRREVSIHLSAVVSMSRLSDVITYGGAASEPIVT